MTCLHLHASLFPMHAKLKQQQQNQIGMEHTTKLLWGEPSRTNPHCKSFSSASSLRTKAIPDFIVVAATSAAPKAGDLSTFLPVSVLLVTVYFISNFVVPDILTKNFGFDKDKKADDVEDK